MKIPNVEKDGLLTKLYKVWPNVLVNELRRNKVSIVFTLETSQNINATSIMKLIREFGTSNISIEPIVIYGGYCDTCSYEAGGYEVTIGPENDIELYKSAISFLRKVEKEK